MPQGKIHSTETAVLFCNQSEEFCFSSFNITNLSMFFTSNVLVLFW